MNPLLHSVFMEMFVTIHCKSSYYFVLKNTVISMNMMCILCRSSLMSCNPVCATPSVNSQQQPVSLTQSSVSIYLLLILQEIHIQSNLLTRDTYTRYGQSKYELQQNALISYPNERV